MKGSKSGRGKIKPFLLKSNPEKVLEPSLSRQFSASVKHKIGVGKPKTIAISLT